MACPFCGSISVMGHQRGYSAGEGLVGGILFGLPGFLMGAFGALSARVTCLDCGKTWKAGEADKIRQRIVREAREDRVMRKLVRVAIGLFALFVAIMYAIFVRF